MDFSYIYCGSADSSTAPTMPTKKPFRVLSLFDGISGGQIALKELGIEPDEYLASEIDKTAISQTQHNFPKTIQLGDVRDLDVRKLGHIDLLIGGSPCTNFSFSGKRNGMNTLDGVEIYTLDEYLKLKAEGFQFEGQSYLFWEYMRVLTELRETNPDIKFMLENVNMATRWKAVLDHAIGCTGVPIDSSLVSAQNRKRIYWTNISDKIEPPEDRHGNFVDILDKNVTDPKYYKLDYFVKQLAKYGTTIVPGAEPFVQQYPRGFNNGFTYHSGKVPTLTTSSWDSNHIIVYPDGTIRKFTHNECARLQTIPDWYEFTCSPSKEIKLLGNGWTIEVIKHILSYLER